MVESVPAAGRGAELFGVDQREVQVAIRILAQIITCIGESLYPQTN